MESSSCSPEYLIQLLKDKRQLQVLPPCFIHLERLLDEEINRVRGSVLHLGIDCEPLQLPDPVGPSVTLQEKLAVPVRDHPDFNFVGRLLGPRGMTAKQLEMETGCKILIRGRGSMRDKHKEDLMRGKAKWEHLNEDLHVLVTVEDTSTRAAIKLKRASEQVKKLLVPSPESEDELKKRQLMELALINGTYRGFLNNNNNNNNNNNIVNTNGISLLMMPQGGSFCQSGLQGIIPAGGLPMGHSSGSPQLFVMSEHAGAPIFLAGPPPMMSPCHGSLPPLPSPALSPPPMLSPEMCKVSLPMSVMPSPNHLGSSIFYHSFDPLMTPNTIPMSVSSPLFEYPLPLPSMTMNNELCHSSSMTSYVH